MVAPTNGRFSVNQAGHDAALAQFDIPPAVLGLEQAGLVVRVGPLTVTLTAAGRQRARELKAKAAA